MGNKVTSVIGVDTDSVDDTAKFSLGTVAQGDDATYQYVLAAATISTVSTEASRFSVAIDENYSASLITTANATTWRRHGVAPAKAVASGKYFWARVVGNGPMRVVASAAADVSLRTTTTAGRLGSASTASSVVYPGIVLVTAASASGGSAGSTTRTAIVVSNLPTRKSAITIGTF